MVPSDCRNRKGCAPALEHGETNDHMTKNSITARVGMGHLSTRGNANVLQTSYQKMEGCREGSHERSSIARWPPGRAGSKLFAS
ncbi:MAG: hypothetical protein LZF60_80297 [Nitrospira sp.]|nr:MAG: hypothetical protein LZF60_80297 [Nitrospira sp.]